MQRLYPLPSFIPYHVYTNIQYTQHALSQIEEFSIKHTNKCYHHPILKLFVIYTFHTLFMARLVCSTQLYNKIKIRSSLNKTKKRMELRWWRNEQAGTRSQVPARGTTLTMSTRTLRALQVMDEGRVRLPGSPAGPPGTEPLGPPLWGSIYCPLCHLVCRQICHMLRCGILFLMTVLHCNMT